jgi:hypothetical protein
MSEKFVSKAVDEKGMGWMFRVVEVGSGVRLGWLPVTRRHRLDNLESEVFGGAYTIF